MRKYIPIIPFMKGHARTREGKPLPLTWFQEKMMHHFLTPDGIGRLPYRTIVYSTIKKSGKSAMGQEATKWYAYGGLAEPRDECFCIANSKEHAGKLAYSSLVHEAQTHPKLMPITKEANGTIIRTNRDVTIKPVSCDGGSNAGQFNNWMFYDEIWNYTLPSHELLWSELTPINIPRNSLRFVTTYAGFIEKSFILWELYDKCVNRGERVFDDLPVWRNGDTIYYHDEGEEARRMPWQVGPAAEEYYEKQREDLPLHQYLRLHMNKWTAGEHDLPMDDWDACVDSKHHWPAANKRLYLSVGIDASTDSDWTSIMTVYKQGGRYYMGPYKIIRPLETGDAGAGFKINFKQQIRTFVDELRKRYRIYCIYFDPYQMVSEAQEYEEWGLNVRRWNQTAANAMAMGNALRDCLKTREITLFHDRALRKQAAMTVITESPRGLKLEKTKQVHKVDSIIGLSMALFGAIEELPDIDATRSFKESFMAMG